MHRMGVAAATAVAGIVSAASAGLAFDDVDVVSWTGEGANEALLILDWTEGRQLAFGYRWGLLETATGLDMLEAVNAATGRLDRTWVEGLEFEAIFSLGWDADDDGFSPDDPDDWFAEGWFENGFWGYWVATDGTDWDFAPAGLSERVLADGDWDGFAWAPDFDGAAPMVPLVPAPAAWCGLLLLAGRDRRRRA